MNQEVRRSDKAKQILENPIFKESIEELKKLYTSSLFNTGVKETDTREKLWMAYQIVGKVENHIKEILDTGKLASKQLEDFRTQEKSKRF